MNHYEHRKSRPLSWLSRTLRGLARVLRLWPLFLVAFLVVSPAGPHMRFQYTYHQVGSAKYMIDCEYLGARGFVRYVRSSTCPFFIWLDTRELK